MTDVRPPESPKLRIGDRVRSLVDDVCVTVGLEGLVVNVAPPRPYAPARARVLWDNETVSMADAPTFEVIPLPNAKPQQPTVMAPFPGSAA